MMRRGCNADEVLGSRTNNNKDAEGVAVQMKCWEKGPVAAQMQRELLLKFLSLLS